MKNVVFSVSEKTANRLKELMFDDSSSNWTVAPIQTSSFGDGTELALSAFVLPGKELMYQLSFRMESNHSVVFQSVTTSRMADFSKENWLNDFGAYTNKAFKCRSVENLGTKLGVNISATMSFGFDIEVHGIHELYKRLVEISNIDADIVNHRTLFEEKKDDSTFRIFLAFSKNDPLTLIGQEIFNESKFGDAYSRAIFSVSVVDGLGLFDISCIKTAKQFADVLNSLAKKLQPSYYINFKFVD